MSRMRVRLLDIDGSLTDQPALREAVERGHASWIGLRDLAPRLRIVASRGALRELRARLEADDLAAHMADEGVATADFFGSGDFHHITAVLLARFREPLTVIHIDNHPDWVRWPPTFNCGGWINRALELPHVRRIITFGPCSDDLVWPELKRANLQALSLGRLELYPWRHAPSRVFGEYGEGPSFTSRDGRLVWRTLANEPWELFVEWLIARIPTEAVYLTLDKDALIASDAATNWDQGEMRLDHVLELLTRVARARRLVGADVCGDYSRPRFSGVGRALLSWFDRGAVAPITSERLALNGATNARLVDAFMRGAA